ncbi:hypothetical protein CJI97_003818 [Candidozyma auris]|nr:hypothetical protein CJI97_003818 [[Candida] auris]
MSSPRKQFSSPQLSKSVSPIRRSGSPDRRRQIAQLEQGFREKRQKPNEPQSSPSKTVTFSDMPRLSTSATTDTTATGTDDGPSTQEILAQMASALDKVATTFSTTAAQLKDSKETQQRTLDEVAQLRQVVQKLQKDVHLLLERDRKS